LQYEQTGCHTDRESRNIDERKYFILSNIAPRGCKITFEHNFIYLQCLTVYS
jgi:hypothetical protein